MLVDALTIDATALYAVAAPNVPQAARSAVIEQAEAGEHITKAEADRIIANADLEMRHELREAIAEEGMASLERLQAAMELVRKRHA